MIRSQSKCDSDAGWSSKMNKKETVMWKLNRRNDENGSEHCVHPNKIDNMERKDGWDGEKA